MRAAMGAMADGLSLDPEFLLAAATTETGLSDFGDDAFRERLDVLTRAFREEAGLSPQGVVATYAQLTQHLKNRLLVEDLLRRHPEIHDVRIERPIIICGLPRTGTTHLHNLISADTDAALTPLLGEPRAGARRARQPAPGEPDPRLARTEVGLQFLDAAAPYFKRMHEMTVDHVHEEIQLLAIDLSTMLFDTAGADADLARLLPRPRPDTELPSTCARS